jgi:tetratricopeptide (TPR) repeat protein
MKEIDSPQQPGVTDLADLVEEFVARVQAGEAVDPESFAQAHPDHAQELRELLLAALPLTDRGRGPRMEGDLPAARLGDFQLIREIGRGGSGIVFEAEQVSLGRRVAVKVLPSTVALDARYLQRLKNEAQAAAQLRHPHIVPVLAVGQEGQTHFFAMQYIDGRNLAALIAELHQPAGNPLATEEPGADRAYFRNVARLVRQAAEALDHAHQVGIIHRDVKPGNLLVDTQGDLWVTDFGLARLGESPGVTDTGDRMGSVRYMSPEQAQGLRAPVDHRSDIYGLGVTAYELVTLRPAFQGDDRQELIRRIATEEPPRPRRVNPAAPVELEAILLKAMEKNPSHRYATAQELADDLGRFLADVPIHARRASAWRAVSRWARRHAGLMAMVGGAAIAGVLVLAIAVTLLAVDNRRLREEGGKVRDALRDATENDAKVGDALQRAQENARRARSNGRLVGDALSAVMLQIADEQVTQRPHGARKTEEMLARAQRVYQLVCDGAEEDEELLLEVAGGFHKIAQQFWRLGRSEEALRGHRKSLDLAQRLVEGDPDNFLIRLLIAACHREMAAVHLQMGKHDEAAAAFREALAAWEWPTNLAPCKLEESLAHAGLAEVEEASGHVAEAAAHYRAAIELREALATLQPQEALHRGLLADWHRSLGFLLLGTGNHAEADTHLGRACELAERLLADSRDTPEYQVELAQCSFLRARLHEVSHPKRAAQWYSRAGELLGALAAAMPGVPLYRQNLADVHFHLGLLDHVAGREAQATQHFRKVHDLCSGLVAAEPGEGPAPGFPGVSENGFAWFLATCPDESFRNPRRAVELAREAVKRAPHKGDHWNTLGAALCRVGNHKEALPALEKALQLHREAEGTDLFLLAIAHHALDQPEKARQRYDEGNTLLERQGSETLDLHLLRLEAGSLLGLTVKSVARPRFSLGQELRPAEGAALPPGSGLVSLSTAVTGP